VDVLYREQIAAKSAVPRISPAAQSDGRDNLCMQRIPVRAEAALSKRHD
jgi:hypothetical protein